MVTVTLTGWSTTTGILSKTYVRWPATTKKQCMGESIMIMWQRKQVHIQSMVGMGIILANKKKKTPKKRGRTNTTTITRIRITTTTTTTTTNKYAAWIRINNH